jgi:hypothetical protein
MIGQHPSYVLALMARINRLFVEPFNFLEDTSIVGISTANSFRVLIPPW